MLNRSGEYRHPYFFPILGESIQCFTVKLDVSCSLSLMYFIILRTFISFPSVLRIFIVNFFSASVELIISLFSFILLI